MDGLWAPEGNKEAGEVAADPATSLQDIYRKTPAKTEAFL